MVTKRLYGAGASERSIVHEAGAAPPLVPLGSAPPVTIKSGPPPAPPVPPAPVQSMPDPAPPLVKLIPPVPVPIIPDPLLTLPVPPIPPLVAPIMLGRIALEELLKPGADGIRESGDAPPDGGIVTATAPLAVPEVVLANTSGIIAPSTGLEGVFTNTGPPGYNAVGVGAAAGGGAFSFFFNVFGSINKVEIIVSGYKIFTLSLTCECIESN